MRDLVILIAWAALLPFSIARPYVGALIWAWTALLSPNYYLYGFMSGVQFNKIISVVTLIVTFLSKEPKKLYPDATLYLITALFLLVTISCLLAPHQHPGMW